MTGEQLFAESLAGEEPGEAVTHLTPSRRARCCRGTFIPTRTRSPMWSQGDFSFEVEGERHEAAEGRAKPSISGRMSCIAA